MDKKEIECPHCFKSHPDTQKFCTDTGYKIGPQCAHCKKWHLNTQKFCTETGNRYGPLCPECNKIHEEKPDTCPVKKSKIKWDLPAVKAETTSTAPVKSPMKGFTSKNSDNVVPGSDRVKDRLGMWENVKNRPDPTANYKHVSVAKEGIGSKCQACKSLFFFESGLGKRLCRTCDGAKAGHCLCLGFTNEMWEAKDEPNCPVCKGKKKDWCIKNCPATGNNPLCKDCKGPLCKHEKHVDSYGFKKGLVDDWSCNNCGAENSRDMELCKECSIKIGAKPMSCKQCHNITWNTSECDLCGKNPNEPPKFELPEKSEGSKFHKQFEKENKIVEYPILIQCTGCLVCRSLEKKEQFYAVDLGKDFNHPSCTLAPGNWVYYPPFAERCRKCNFLKDKVCFCDAKDMFKKKGIVIGDFDPVPQIKNPEVNITRCNEKPGVKDGDHPKLVEDVKRGDDLVAGMQVCLGQFTRKEENMQGESGVVKTVLHMAANFVESAQELLELCLLYGEWKTGSDRKGNIASLSKLLTDADILTGMKTFIEELLGVKLPTIILTNREVTVEVKSVNFDLSGKNIPVPIKVKGWIPKEIMGRDISPLLCLLDGVLPTLCGQIIRKMMIGSIVEGLGVITFTPHLKHIGLQNDGVLEKIRTVMSKHPVCSQPKPCHRFNLTFCYQNVTISDRFHKKGIYGNVGKDGDFGWQALIYSGDTINTVVQSMILIMQSMATLAGVADAATKGYKKLKASDILSHMKLTGSKNDEVLDLIFQSDNTGPGMRGLEMGGEDEYDDSDVVYVSPFEDGPFVGVRVTPGNPPSICKQTLGLMFGVGYQFFLREKRTNFFTSPENVRPGRMYIVHNHCVMDADSDDDNNNDTPSYAPSPAKMKSFMAMDLSASAMDDQASLASGNELEAAVVDWLSQNGGCNNLRQSDYLKSCRTYMDALSGRGITDWGSAMAMSDDDWRGLGLPIGLINRLKRGAL
eukprot:CAMPEP_0177665910 /NCGR_PEP_ID=MMETSP0447-20121125/21303_1 /TAXON_ID=0 /ORGANISM="Stygamoeba regulata, Strain BSH-02190019" /LENGTH=967 /DNA_ID=CAMNT_0019172029 /DNA_START=25 /DNA_END=2929 /DNA_ORIENTATION=+